MATKLYLTNRTAPYTPATIRGTFDDTAGSTTKALDTVKGAGGVTATIARAEAVTTNPYRVLLYRGVGGPMAAQTISGTVNVCIQILESNAAADFHWYLHVYVTQGDSDTPRGTLLADYSEALGVNEWPTSATGKLLTAAQAISSLAVTAGDRIVVEIGYISRNGVSTSRTGTLRYGLVDAGGVDLPDLSDGSTSNATAPFVTFSGDIDWAASGNVARVSHAVAETLLEVPSAAAVSHVVIEAVVDTVTTVSARVSQVVIEAVVEVGFPVPDVVGETVAGATILIEADGFIVGTITYAHDAVIPAGDVISQDPAAGAVVAVGSAVNLVVSVGPTIPGSISQVPVEVAASLGSGAEVGLSGLPTEVSARNDTTTQVGVSGVPVEVMTRLTTVAGLGFLVSGVPVEILMGVEVQLPPVEPYPGPELPPVGPVPSTLTATLLRLRRVRRATHLSQEEFRIFYHRLQVDAQMGVGLGGAEQLGSDPQMMLRWSDDGGQTWSNEHWVSMGRLGRYATRAIFDRMGQARDRVFEIAVSDPVQWCIIDAFIQTSVGDS